jgi:hypothetical protein
MRPVFRKDDNIDKCLNFCGRIEEREARKLVLLKLVHPVCQDGTHRLQGDTTNSTRLATRNETMPSTEAPVSDIARRRESRPGR